MISTKKVFTSNLTFIDLRTRILISKRMSVISVYWFVAQQQNSRWGRQSTESIYSKFQVEENELTPTFKKPKGCSLKSEKIKQCLKNV